VPHSAHRGGLELGTGTGLYGACRSTQCCLAVWSRWLESSTRLGGFRALKKTQEAPYTTKVNYREAASRGTTRLGRWWCVRLYLAWSVGRVLLVSSLTNYFCQIIINHTSRRARKRVQ
jgi:hypothetical protein